MSVCPPVHGGSVHHVIGASPPLTYVGIPSDLFKPVHLGTYHRICKPYIYWQAGSCPSTESLPVFMMFVSVCSDGCKTEGRSLTPYLANYFCIKMSLIIALIPCKNYIEILKKKGFENDVAFAFAHCKCTII